MISGAKATSNKSSKRNNSKNRFPGKKYEHVTCNISIKKEYYTSWDPKRVNTHAKEKQDQTRKTVKQTKRHGKINGRPMDQKQETYPEVHTVSSMIQENHASDNVPFNATHHQDLRKCQSKQFESWLNLTPCPVVPKTSWYYFHKTKRLLFSTSTDVPNNFVVIHEFQFLKGTLVAIHKKHTSDMEIRRATLPKKIL